MATLITTTLRNGGSSAITTALCCAARYQRPWIQQNSASFSTTANFARVTRIRQAFNKWLGTRGCQYRSPREDGQSNYLAGAPQRGSDHPEIDDQLRPFPLNREFISEPVLDEVARETIWQKVMQKGETIKAVSAQLGVDIKRVAAVVRLMEVEKEWVLKGKRLARPYQKAILQMVPSTTLKNDEFKKMLFEPINELHVHSTTMKQLFWPTAESRQFTREDAARAFGNGMVSTDKRVPHPELIRMEKDLLQGKSPYEAHQTFIATTVEAERKAAERQRKRAALVAHETTTVLTDRFEFRFQAINSELVGPKGRSRQAIGWKYGMPHYDRVKGAVKIPTSVP